MSELKTLSLITTLQCTSSCEHCCFGCHPTKSDKMNRELILHCIEEASKIDTVKSVVFTGGECTLLGDVLYQNIMRATEHGKSTRCVSNAWWAKDIFAAEKVVKQLKQAGLKELNISTGEHHQKYVPLDNVVNAAISALRNNLTTAINVEMFKNSATLGNTISKLQRLADENKTLILKYALWVSNGGKSTIEHDDNVKLYKREKYFGCQYVLSTLSILPNGDVASCCGLTLKNISEMIIGNIWGKSLHELNDIARSDFIKIWLAVDGPERILHYAMQKNPKIVLSEEFVHPCQACQLLYEKRDWHEAITNIAREKAEEVYDKYLAQIKIRKHLCAA